MAVQAQYPSNILLLNRSAQEGHEFSVQQQSGGGFIDESHMLFNNDHMNNNNNMNNNPRKRGREVAAGPMNSFSLQMQTQTQTPQLIDLSQLHQPNVTSTGLRLSFADQQQNLQQAHHNQNHTYPQQQQQQQQQQLNLLFNSSAFSSLVTDNFSTLIKRHREELDQFLQAQGEVLRRTLAEKRQRHSRELLGAAQESVSRRLKEKETELEKAKRRKVELEARIIQVSTETQVWQMKARAQEAMAASLQAQLQQAIMSKGGIVVAHDSRRGDEELNCGGGVERQAEDAESAYVDPEQVVGSGQGCKVCRTHVASVVLLPCQHLCLCRECDRVTQTCPLCLTVKNSSVEVFLC